MHAIDWTIIILPLLVVLAIGVFAQRFMKSVADFMSGGRLAGRYLLCVAQGEMQAGAVVFVASFEMISRSGFTLTWWNWMNVPVGLLVAIFGFVIYRFRETRAMTLAQFFEIRYSKSFRVFTGILAFGAGIVNFGIIPAVGARFFVYFLHMPPVMTVLGFSVPTYVLLMAGFLCVSLFLTLTGGLITMMITDCVEGMLSQIFYLVIIAGLLTTFSWTEISETLASKSPGESLLNPFDASQIKDFNISYVLMGMFLAVYGTMAWQNASAYNSAALSAHESRMAGILGRWRGAGKMAVVTLLAICAMTYLDHSDYAVQSAQVYGILDQIPQPQIREQMRVPVALSYLLPIGVKGALCALLLMGIFGGDSTHLHSWGGIFVQDVLVPLRKKPFGPKQHIRALRLSILGVAFFAFLFGALFQQTEYIAMWWAVTMSLYVGGAGAAIIGGLYWKKGTAAGAWAGLIAGSGLSAGGIVLRQIYGRGFPLNGMEISFYATLIAIGIYVVISLLTHTEDFNMDRMLHRAEYAKLKEFVGDSEKILPHPVRPVAWGRLIGIDGNFTLGDKWIAGSLFAWSMGWFSIMVIGSIWNLFAPWPTSVWSRFWQISGIGIPIVISLVTAVWFVWGGTRDIGRLFRDLRRQKVNPLDDGSVVNHQNLDEAAVVDQSQARNK